MKKMIALVLVVVLCGGLVLTACGSPSGPTLIVNTGNGDVDTGNSDDHSDNSTAQTP